MQNHINKVRAMVLGMERAIGAPLPDARAAVDALAALAESPTATPAAAVRPVTVGASVEQLAREFTEQVAPVATLNQWRDLIMAWADSKGWNDKSILDEKGEVRNEFLGEQLMLVTTELAEAQEDNRSGKLATYYEEGTGKPCGLPSELADAMIRIFHLSARLGIDLNREVGVKMAYNYSRAKRHGGLRS